MSRHGLFYPRWRGFTPFLSNRRVMKKLLIIILLLAFPFPCFGEEFYVCSSSAGINNGSSWANCWAYADVFGGATNWDSTKTAGKIGPGDTVYIDGGAFGVTYTAQFYTRARGTDASTPITFRPGSYSPSPSGHDGKVTITNASGHGAYIFNSNIVLNGKKSSSDTSINMRFTGSLYNGIYGGTSARGLVLTCLEIDNNGSETGNSALENGIRLNYDNGGTDIQKAEISYCDIHDNWQDQISVYAGNLTSYGAVLIHHNKIYNLQDDGVETGGNGVDLYENEVYSITTGSKGAGHPDGLVIMGSYGRIWNNYIHDFVSTDNVGKTNAYIYLNPYTTIADSSHCCIRIYNNLVVQTVGNQADNYPRGIEVSWQTGGSGSWASVSDIIIANNTIIGLPFSGISLYPPLTVTDMYVVNNLVHDCGKLGVSYWSYAIGASACATIGSWGDPAGVLFDYNINSAGTGGQTNINRAGTLNAYAKWKSEAGTQKNISNETNNPNLSASYKPQVSSTNILNTGRNLSTYFIIDKEGTTRCNWTIGAYEYIPERAQADLDEDEDVDGSDLALLIFNPSLVDLPTFAQEFGTRQ